MDRSQLFDGAEVRLDRDFCGVLNIMDICRKSRTGAATPRPVRACLRRGGSDGARTGSPQLAPAGSRSPITGATTTARSRRVLFPVAGYGSMRQALQSASGTSTPGAQDGTPHSCRLSRSPGWTTWRRNRCRPWPRSGSSLAEDRAVLQAEAAALAPWQLDAAAQGSLSSAQRRRSSARTSHQSRRQKPMHRKCCCRCRRAG